MNDLEFYASMVKSLAWPVAAFAIAFMFRKQVVVLLEKVKSLKGAGIEAVFAEDTKKIAAKVNAILPGDAHANSLESYLGKKFVPPADERPLAMILDAWSDLEDAIAKMLDELGIETKKPANLRNCLEALKEFVPPDTRVFIDELHRLRNEAAKNSDLDPDEGTAYRYQISVRNVIQSLQQRTAYLKAHWSSQHGEE
ncbi:hypothetical protein LJR118_001239 [Acidovorax sp. LjRoot118]|uniref:hypothetical protein n=1 Tax=Acidovorax sp. LjRoot118 TaxID=3342256 RepID=UPI003ECD30B7